MSVRYLVLSSPPISVPILILGCIPLLVLKLKCDPSYTLDLVLINLCRVQTTPFWRVLDVQICLGLVGVGQIWIIVERKKV